MFLTKINNFKLLQWCGSRAYSSKSTIFGLSSGAGKCGVAVLRISGDGSADVLKKMTKMTLLPPPRIAKLKKIFHPLSDNLIDKGLILWFAGPNSFTGEDSCEFHVHGGPAIVSAMYESFSTFKDLRIAEPGEFTKRAFYAGKMDLTEVEGLADLIDAETEAQRKQAVLQANGELSHLYKMFRERVVRCIANVEAYIDFAEDQHIDDNILEEMNAELAKIQTDLNKHLNDNRRGERLRNGVRTVILGAPNVGKSSFVNLICQRNISIVTHIEGTTRDIIESHYDIGGYPIILADTAGLRTHTDNIVEIEGILRARNYITSSDFVIILIDASKMLKYFEETGHKSIEDYYNSYLKELGLECKHLNEDGRKTMTIINKSDLLQNLNMESNKNIKIMSCLEKTGVEEVLQEMTHNLQHLCGNPTTENVNLSQERHRFHLTECLGYIKKYRELVSSDTNPDLAIAAQQLRQATRSIGRITGDVDTEEILDVIFKNFCIGK